MTADRLPRRARICLALGYLLALRVANFITYHTRPMPPKDTEKKDNV